MLRSRKTPHPRPKNFKIAKLISAPYNYTMETLPPIKSPPVLSKMQRLFVDAFVGCPIEACRIAGYSGNDAALRRRGEELLQNPLVIEAMRERQKYMIKSQAAVADRDEIFSFWTDIMKNKDAHAFEEKDSYGVPKPKENIAIQHRLKASEMLAKGQGLFVDKLEIDGKVTVSEIVRQSFLTPDDELEAIEAEYERIHSERLSYPSEPLSDEPESSLSDFI